MPITAVDHRITLNEAIENLEEIGYSTAGLQGNKWRDECNTLLNSIQEGINQAISNGIANGSFGENDSALKNTIETAMKDPLTRTLSRHTWAKIDAIGAQVTISDGHGEAKQISLSKLLTNFYKLREALNRKQAIKAQLEHEEKIRENREAIAKLDEEGKKKLRELINNQNTPAETLSKTDGIYNGSRGAYFVLYDDSGKTTVRVEKWSESNLRKAFTEAFSPGDKVHIVGWSALSPEDQRVAIQVAFEAGIDVVDSELYQLGFRVNNSPADNLAVLYNLEYGFNHGSKSRPGWLNDKMLTNLRELSTNQLKDEHAAIEAEKEVLGNQFSEVKDTTGKFSLELLEKYGPSNEILEKAISNNEAVNIWSHSLTKTRQDKLLETLRELYNKRGSTQEDFEKALKETDFFKDINEHGIITDRLAKDLAENYQNILLDIENNLADCLVYDAIKGQLHATTPFLYRGKDNEDSTEIDQKLEKFIKSQDPSIEQIQLIRLQENIGDLSIFQDGIIKNKLALLTPQQKQTLALSNFPPPTLTALNSKISLNGCQIQLKDDQLKQTMKAIFKQLGNENVEQGLMERLESSISNNETPFTMSGDEFIQLYTKASESKIPVHRQLKSDFVTMFGHCINNCLQNTDGKPITILTAGCVTKMQDNGINTVNGVDLAGCVLKFNKNSKARSKLLSALKKIKETNTQNDLIDSTISKLEDNDPATISLQDYKSIVSLISEAGAEEYKDALQACQDCLVLKSEEDPTYITTEKDEASWIQTIKPIIESINTLKRVEQLRDNADPRTQQELEKHFAQTLKPVQVNDMLQLVSELDKLYGDNKDPELSKAIANMKNILNTKNDAGEVKLDLKGLIAIQDLATKASVKLQEAKRKAVPSMARFLTQEKQFSYKFKKPSYKNNLKNEQQTFLTKIEENIRKKLGISVNSEANPEEPNEAPVNNA